MPYRAMALVAASLLIATQCYAATVVKGSKSNSDRKLATVFGHNAPKAANIKGGRSNTSRMGGGGGGKGAAQRDNNPPRGGQGPDLPGRR